MRALSTAVQPPSVAYVAPVMLEASSDSRNRIVAACSAGVAMRWPESAYISRLCVFSMPMFASPACAGSPAMAFITSATLEKAACVIGVAVAAMLTEFTRMP